MSEHHPISDLMTETMSKIKEMVDVNTIIGNPIVAADGTTVIPHQRTGVRHGGSSGRDDPGCDQQGVQFRQRLQGQDRGRSRSGGTPVRRRIKPRFPAKPTRVNAE